MDESDAKLALQALQLLAHLDAQERIQRRQRLVQQQDAWLGDQCAGQRDALLLATGKLCRQTLGVGFHVDQSKELARLLVALGFANAAHFQAEGDVVDAVQMRK